MIYPLLHHKEQFMALKIPIFHLFLLPPLTPNLCNHLSFNCLNNFAFCKIPYSWNHTVFILFRLTAFTQDDAFNSLPCFSWLDTSFIFLSLNSIPLHENTTICLFVHWKIFWLLKFLTIINKATINICMQVFVWTYIFSLFGKKLGAKLLGSKVKLCLSL